MSHSAYLLLWAFGLLSCPLNPSYLSSEERHQEAWGSLRLNAALSMVLSSRQLISTSPCAMNRYWVHVTVALYESLGLELKVDIHIVFLSLHNSDFFFFWRCKIHDCHLMLKTDRGEWGHENIENLWIWLIKEEKCKRTASFNSEVLCLV